MLRNANAKYGTRAIKGRSRLVAALLMFQAESDILCHLYARNLCRNYR